MRKQIAVLDCTLRDGGYINQWSFGYDIIKNIIRDLVASSIEIVEIGFLRNCTYDSNITCFNNIAEIKNVLPADKGKTKFSAMILYTNYDIDKLEDNDGTIDYLRVTFHNYDYQQGLDYCRKLQAKGYNIFVNPINIMGYKDDELVDLIRSINEMHPYGMSIVDTFGVMTRQDLMRVYSICENNLLGDIVLGLHLHDNLSMAFSLAQYFLEMKKPTRKCVIDGSLYGMGRKPGNLCIELIMDYLCEVYGKDYDLDSVFDAIENYMYPINKLDPWGYSIEYFLSAKNRVHRNYAEFYQQKGRLTAKAINHLLSIISGGYRDKYDEKYADQLYMDYILRNNVDDSTIYEKFSANAKGKTLVLLAPGPSSVNCEPIINELGDRKDILVIAANHYPKVFEPDYCFFSNMRRYEEFRGSKMTNVIVTSNIEADSKDRTVYTLNLKKLAESGFGFSDSCGVLLVRFARQILPEKIVLIGFDGLTKKDFDYYQGHYGNFINANLDSGDSLKNAVERTLETCEVVIY